MSGPSPAQAAQRNYLQALHAEVAEKPSTSACSTSVQPSRTRPSTPRGKGHSCGRRRSRGRLPSTPELLAIPPWTKHDTKGNNGKPSIRSIACPDPFHERLVAVFPQIRQFPTRQLDPLEQNHDRPVSS